MLSIRHETVYRYTAPLAYTIQQLRLMPRAEPHQHVQSWHISTAGKCHPFTDAFGNASHTLTINGQHQEVRIIAAGIVDVQPLDRGRIMEKGLLSPLVFTVPTRLTEPAEVVRQFAGLHLGSGRRSAELLSLAAAIQSEVIYTSGATGVTSTAADALQLKLGVCQDHAHVFIACCHAHDIPARYVSGYIHAGDTDHAESHAWVDVWVDEVDYSGWISIDVTHAQFASDMHCRVAIGRDYDSAAPVRGVRHGGGLETMTVQVDVATA